MTDVINGFLCKIVSSPNKSLNGVNLVALDLEISCDQTTTMSSSGHFPFGSMNHFMAMPNRMMSFASSTKPFDSGSLKDYDSLVSR